jgi:hypothetical protein
MKLVAPGERFCQTTCPSGTLSELRRRFGSTCRSTPRSRETARASATDLPTRFGVGRERPLTKKVNEK